MLDKITQWLQRMWMEHRTWCIVVLVVVSLLLLGLLVWGLWQVWLLLFGGAGAVAPKVIEGIKVEQDRKAQEEQRRAAYEVVKARLDEQTRAQEQAHVQVVQQAQEQAQKEIGDVLQKDDAGRNDQLDKLADEHRNGK